MTPAEASRDASMACSRLADASRALLELLRAEGMPSALASSSCVDEVKRGIRDARSLAGGIAAAMAPSVPGEFDEDGARDELSMVWGE